MISVLLVNHGLSKFCGIYNHGIRMGNILKDSKKYNFIYCEATSQKELIGLVEKHQPRAIIYNYTIGLLPFVQGIKEVLPNIKHLGMCHDVLPQNMRSMLEGFDYRIALDPTIQTSDRWFKSVRPLFNYSKKGEVNNKIPTIGSFGFYFKHKNFESLILYVINEFNEAKIRLHITKAHFSSESDKTGLDRFITWAKGYVNDFNMRGKKIEIEISTDYLTDEEQIDWLSENDINIFPYSQNYGSGPSSAIDYSVAAGRPIMISDSHQFIHVRGRFPDVANCRIMDAIKAGNAETLKLQEEWSEENFRKEYENIINNTL